MRRMTYPLQLSFLFVVFFSSWAKAQTTVCKPPIGRVLWHDKIDRAQKRLVDQKINTGDNEDLNYFVNQAITKKVDALQCAIETDASLTDQPKKGYLAGVENLLKNYYTQYRSHQITAALFPTVLEAFEKAMALNKKGE